MKALFHRKQVEIENKVGRVPYKKIYSAVNMKRYFALGVITILMFFITTSVIISRLQAEMIEDDVGIPFYPGSKQIPSYIPTPADNNHTSFRNITLVTSDSFKKVLNFYQEKLGKFSTSNSQVYTKSALWNESTTKGYRIITLLEAEEGTKITITKRIWQSVDKTSHQKSY